VAREWKCREFSGSECEAVITIITTETYQPTRKTPREYPAPDCPPGRPRINNQRRSCPLDHTQRPNQNPDPAPPILPRVRPRPPIQRPGLSTQIERDPGPRAPAAAPRPAPIRAPALDPAPRGHIPAVLRKRKRIFSMRLPYVMLEWIPIGRPAPTPHRPQAHPETDREHTRTAPSPRRKPTGNRHGIRPRRPSRMPTVTRYRRPRADTSASREIAPSAAPESSPRPARTESRAQAPGRVAWLCVPCGGLRQSLAWNMPRAGGLGRLT
jgi:hypothetical protein